VSETLTELLGAPVPKLERGEALVAFVRASAGRDGNSPPPAFAIRRQRTELLQAILDGEREGTHALVRQAFRRGVPISTLARWTGYTPRWISTIVESEKVTA